MAGSTIYGCLGMYALVFLVLQGSATHLTRPFRGHDFPSPHHDHAHDDQLAEKEAVSDIASQNDRAVSRLPRTNAASESGCRRGAFAWATPELISVQGSLDLVDMRLQDEAECKILSNVFGYGMQALLGVLCVGVLYLKWSMEVPRRWFVIFVLDVAKQILGGILYHLLNMIIAMRLSSIGADLSADECAWYFINFMADTTVGLMLTVIQLRASEPLFGYVSGEYWNEEAVRRPNACWTEKLDWRKWCFQLMIYLVIVTLAKFCIVHLIIYFILFAGRLGELGTMWIRNTKLRLFWVMVFVPAVMDTLFMCITDECIKSDGGDGEPLPDKKTAAS
eukprot:TRINITY_DN12641_c0_g1_i1.p1 TRINITY_DN12641_c0_g1~~TRINITY_DN12641_c0_g1_i1.p1  ORF type:complete len:335 (+),score=46.96 TRINITY_DN12641_c0_g1_i1:187-1191(+)